jgi:hypothetical protein
MTEFKSFNTNNINKIIQKNRRPNVVVGICILVSVTRSSGFISRSKSDNYFTLAKEALLLLLLAPK